MFEQELERLTTTIQSRTIGSRGNVTLQEILAADIPQSMHYYFRKDRKSTRLNSSHVSESRMPSSA